MNDDELYQVPLSGFTQARDALAARLKAAGDAAGAAAVKRARKPSVAAWAANQVVWQAGGAWQRLRESARALRQTHEQAATAEDLRRAMGEQRDALQACEAQAAEHLARAGHAAAPAVMQKVRHTLLAAAHGGPGIVPGHLEQDLQPPGFDALMGVAFAPVPAAPFAAAEPPARAHTAAGRRASEAEAEAGSAKLDAQERAQRRAALKAAQARHAETQRVLARARARLTAAEERRAALVEQLDAARAVCDEAQGQVAAAEEEDAAAERHVRELREDDAEG